MKLRNFRPNHPNDGRMGYRLGRDLWAECANYREYDDWDGNLGVEVQYLLYSRDMYSTPSFSALDRLLAVLRDEYDLVTVMAGPTVLVDGGKTALCVDVDCWGVSGA